MNLEHRSQGRSPRLWFYGYATQANVLRTRKLSESLFGNQIVLLYGYSSEMIFC